MKFWAKPKRQEAGFGGGIDESIAAVMVESDGTLREGTYRQTAHIEGGYAVLELASYEQAVAWAAKFAAACRCAQQVGSSRTTPKIKMVATPFPGHRHFQLTPSG